MSVYGVRVKQVHTFSYLLNERDDELCNSNRNVSRCGLQQITALGRYIPIIITGIKIYDNSKFSTCIEGYVVTLLQFCLHLQLSLS